MKKRRNICYHNWRLIGDCTTQMLLQQGKARGSLQGDMMCVYMLFWSSNAAQHYCSVVTPHYACH